ncbi:MAG: DPP IV N-terminal domain-containing protein [Gemmataceae bacterium]|nr:DPP IV N-terminal domain-containing protein [Gemmataceae bacterium]
MRRTLPRGPLAAAVLLVLVSGGLRPPFAHAQQPLPTVAEQSGYTKTSRYAEVVAFCDELAKRSPAVQVSTFGTSHEGRKLPLLTVADPPVKDAAEAEKAGKLVVLVFANIHAGEVDGKDAILALVRDLTAEKDHPLLRDLVLLVVPILNADGNEKFGPNNRPGQNGPAEAGVRANAQGLDLNRDFVKLESPEVRALVKLMTQWDPAVVIDLHTTNGSKHRYALTYDGPRYPSTDTPVAKWADATLFPEVTKKVKAATGFDIAPYGNFNADRTRWETYAASPRYGLQMVALRGRIGVLSESYTYAPFQDRVKASYEFVKACLETVAANKDAVRKAVSEATDGGRLPVRTETIADADPVPVLGYEEERKDGRRVATDKPKEYRVHHVRAVTPTEFVTKPAAYLIPAKSSAVADTLRRHGVKVEELREDIDLPVEVYALGAVNVATRPFQGHKTATVEAKARPETRRVPAGTFLVRTAQPLGAVAAYLLEPAAEDGLTTWGLFPDLAAGGDFPVVRLPKAVPPLTAGTPRPLPEARQAKKPITDELLGMGGGRGRGFGGFAGNPAGSFQWLPDGEHFLQIKEGKTWKVHARTGKAEPAHDPELLKKSLAALPAVKDPDRVSRNYPTRLTADRTAALVDAGQDLAVAFLDGRPAVKLTKGDGPREYPTFSPTGKHVAFVKGGNLYAAAVGGDGEKQLTHDGGGEVLNGKGDWVYEEEIFNRNGRAYWWSPDGKQLAFMRFDDAPVKKFTIVDTTVTRGRPEVYPYPKSGDPNPLVSLGVVPADGGSPTFLNLGDYKPEDIVVSRVGWLPDGKGVFAYAQNRTQTWLDFVVWDTPDAQPRKVFREQQSAWVEDLGEPNWLPDGRRFLLADAAHHVHLWSLDGDRLGTPAAGDWEVREVVRVDPDEERLYYTGTADGHTRLHLYRTKFDGSGTERLTPAGGNHSVTVAPKGTLYIDRYTDNDTPTQVFLCEAGQGRIRTLDTNPVYERENYTFGNFEAVQIPLKDGFVLEGTLVYPPDFDPSKKYPIWLQTYAGPAAPTVREGWSNGRVYDQILASSGIVSFRVDPRSASGKNAKSAWAAYKQLGVQELKDLEEAVLWLTAKPWADPKRVGISGHSYGGFMTAYALTHSKLFAAGIAGAPVTDWRLYDTIYTERYMLTPKENPEGYDKSSVVKAAKNLHGRLLILHGLMDDNVHVQNTVQLVDALQAADKDFEVMFYPKARHGIGGPHYQRLQLDFIRRTMGLKP